MVSKRSPWKEYVLVEDDHLIDAECFILFPAREMMSEESRQSLDYLALILNGGE